MSPVIATFGQTLRHYRLAAGLSQQELAEAAGLSVRGISDLERGARTTPRLETVRLLGEALGLDDEARSHLIAAARPEVAAQSPEAGGTPAVKQTSPPRSLFVRSLPIPPTRLVGRGTEVDTIAELFRGERTRLVTLTGQGGIGKSRLALEVAHKFVTELEDGATFVDLSPVRDPALVPNVIASQFAIRPESDQAPVDAIASSIEECQCLLIIDNWEHVLEQAPLVAVLLARCPRLLVLATSRERLRLRGEWEIRLEPLSLNGSGDQKLNGEILDLVHSPAMQLFVERAAEASNGFTITAENAAQISEICQRLEGIPLAIELAAARSRNLSPAALLERLTSRLHFLTEGPRDMPPRLQTMRNAIAWSHDLLDPIDQQVLKGLGVFVGGFTVDSSTAVLIEALDSPPLTTSDIELSISSLVEKSLVQVDTHSEPDSRYAMFETIREFMLERLADENRLARLRDLHAAHFLSMVEAVEPALMGPDPMPVFHQLERELGNIRASLAWLVEQRRMEEALRIAGALAWFWTEPRYLREGRQWYLTLLSDELPDIPADVRAKALIAAGDLAIWQGDINGAMLHLEEGYLLWRSIGDRERMAGSLRSLASVALELGQFERADTLLLESRELAQELGNIWEMAAATNLLGLSVVFRGDMLAGIDHHREAVQLWEELEDTDHIVTALGSLGWAHTLSEDWSEAAAAYSRALTLAQKVDDLHQISWCLTGAGIVTLLRNEQTDLAINLLSAADGIREECGTSLWFKHKEVIERLVAQLRDRLGEERYRELTEQGRALTREDAIRLTFRVFQQDGEPAASQ
jgi:predicted ATPase/transcriptional regulator with XRE-family HTH domain